MTKIHGVVWLIVGGSVAAFAKYVESKTNTVGMILFFYVGLIFVGIGVFKIVSKLILKGLNDSHKDISSTINSTIAKMNINKDLSAVKLSNQPNSQAPMVIACQECGTRHYVTSNFCHKCGSLLRK